MLGAHVLAPDVIQGAVVGFQHHRHAPIRMLLAHFTFGCHQRIAHHTDAVGVGIGNGRGQQTGFANPLQTGCVTVAVQHMDPGKTRLQMRRTGTRLDHGDTGMDGSFGGFDIQRVMPDPHTRYIGDCVVKARGARANGYAKLTDTHRSALAIVSKVRPV